MNVRPKKCNLCGGRVEFLPNKEIYGRSYGSGYAYQCMECGALVGTHKNAYRNAMGLLADKEMRVLRRECHALFDATWRTQSERSAMYGWLAEELGIDKSQCHFGWFTKERLLKAKEVLLSRKNNKH